MRSAREGSRRERGNPRVSDVRGAKAWYDGDAGQEIRPVGLNGAIFSGLIVDCA